MKPLKGLKRILYAGIVAGSIALAAACQNPVNPPTPKPQQKTNQLSDNTHVLTSSEDAEISSVSDNSITFSQTPNYSPGDIIASDISDKTPDGLLRKVVSVSGNTVYTTQATLEDAIENTSFSAGKQVNFASKSMGRGTASLIHLTVPLSFTLQGDNAGVAVGMRGELSFDSYADMELKIKNHGIQKFLLQSVSDDYTGIDSGSSASNPDVSISKTIFTYDGIPSFTIGYIPGTPFPIVVKPVVKGIAGFQGDLSAFSEGMTQGASLTLGISYENGTWTPIKDFTKNFTFQGDKGFNIDSAKAYVGVVLNLLLYGVAGGYIGPDAYLRFAQTSTSSDLYGGLEATLGANVQVLGRTLADYHTQVPITEVLLHSWPKSSPPPTPTPEPSKTTFTDPRDGHVYKAVQIGNQTWMAEDMDYDSKDSSCYDNSSSNCNIYGRLYPYSSLSQVAPPGWHVPTFQEWEELEKYLGSSIAGGRLKSTGTLEKGTGLWHSPNTGATNDTAFNGLPGGAYNPPPFGYYVKGYQIDFWSFTSPRGEDEATSYDLINNGSTLVEEDEAYGVNTKHKSYVRCVKDQ